MSVNRSTILELNPRANVFIFVNLGCEMLYVIDQRLKAQHIELHKSIRVMNEITAVFLDEKFIESLIAGSVHTHGKILTPELCKFMLNDVAQSSIMRLESNSMDKLWNLMTTIYKWQLFNSQHQHHLLDITFRHLDGITPTNSNEHLCQLIDCIKNKLLEFWNSTTDEVQLMIYCTNKLWLEQSSTTKISLLIRLGFQALDGTLISDVKSTYCRNFVNYLGENIYIKGAKLAAEGRAAETSNNETVQHISDLAQFLNLHKTYQHEQPIQGVEFEQNLQQCNIIFNDLEQTATSSNVDEFVQLETVYKRHQPIERL